MAETCRYDVDVTDFLTGIDWQPDRNVDIEATVDSLRATRRSARVAERCSAICGTSLCPVGTDGFHMTIYVADDRTFFAGVDASVFAYADSVSDLFRAMRDGIRPTRIGEWALPL